MRQTSGEGSWAVFFDSRRLPVNSTESRRRVWDSARSNRGQQRHTDQQEQPIPVGVL